MMLTRSILTNSPVCRYVIFVKALLFMPSFVQTVKSRRANRPLALCSAITKNCTFLVSKHQQGKYSSDFIGPN